jgi:hypothetical protein
MPGMRVLADLRCTQCDKSYFGDLPSGHGLVYPTLLDADTGEVYNKYGGEWFANWLGDGFVERTDETREVNISGKAAPENPVILNCLDRLYGHAMLKLLNAQYFIDKTDFDLVVIVQSNLRWLVPEEADTIWEVDLPLHSGAEWNDDLAEHFADLINRLGNARLATALPHPQDYEIERFTGIKPFQMSNWSDYGPTVTFVWRDDRTWSPDHRTSGVLSRFRGIFYSGMKQIGKNIDKYEQYLRVRRLGKALKAEWPDLDFAVAGIGEPGGFPDWVADLRTTSPTEADEHKLCERYASSHIVVGVHGSNMLLPSAYAGSVIELVPPLRWENLTQDLLVDGSKDEKEAIYEYRTVPASTNAKTIARIVTTMIKDRPRMELYLKQRWCSNRNKNEINEWRTR